MLFISSLNRLHSFPVLDPFLPRVVELAVSSSDRQTKVR